MTENAPADAIRLLADRIEIQDLVANYNNALDHRDEALARSLFTAESVVGDKVGVEPIINAFRKTWEKYTVLHHLSANLVVEVAGDKATGRATSIMLRGIDGLDTAEAPTYVRYQDTFVRTPEGWRFHTRTFAATAHTTQGS